MPVTAVIQPIQSRHVTEASKPHSPMASQFYTKLVSKSLRLEFNTFDYEISRVGVFV